MDLITDSKDERLFRAGSWDVRCGYELLVNSLRSALAERDALLKRAEAAEKERGEWESKCVDARLRAFDQDAKRIFAEKERDEARGQVCRAREAIQLALAVGCAYPEGTLARMDEHTQNVLTAALSSSSPCTHREAVEWALSGPGCTGTAGFPKRDTTLATCWTLPTGFQAELRRRAEGGK